MKPTEAETQARRLVAAIRRKRKASGLTQEDVAEKLNVCKHTIQRIEGIESRHFGLDFLIEYAAAVGLVLEIDVREPLHGAT